MEMGKNNLYTIRTERNLSLRQLERLSGISRTTLNRIENESTDPGQTTMICVARALKMEVTDIFNFNYKP